MGTTTVPNNYKSTLYGDVDCKWLALYLIWLIINYTGRLMQTINPNNSDAIIFKHPTDCIHLSLNNLYTINKTYTSVCFLPR